MSSKGIGKTNNKWKQTRHDKFYKLAKEQGFRSRASFKLIQINKQYNFLSSAKALLDLCAAPGGWLQVASKYMPVPSMIIGIDLLPIKPIKNVVALQEDITTQKCRAAIKKELQGWQVDVVLHDGSPDLGGAWAKDAYGQNELVLHSLKLGTEFLREGGVFVTKIFRSADYNSLLWALKQFFKNVDVTKPAASRAASAEIFAVCRGYLAPKKIDPRLLDPAFVFKHIAQKKQAVDIFATKQKRNRSGYDDDVKQHMFKSCSVVNFIEQGDPLAVLAGHNAFTFDEAAKPFLNHAATSEEIKQLVADLKVLGKSDFKHLLKWRMKMRQYKRQLEKEAAATTPAPAPTSSTPATTADSKDSKDAKTTATGKVEEKKGAEAEEEDKEESEEQRADELLEEFKARIEKKRKKDLKKKREEKAKQRKRMDLNMHNATASDVNDEDIELFRLQSIKSGDQLDTLTKKPTLKTKAGEDVEDDVAEDGVDMQEILEKDQHDVGGIEHMPDQGADLGLEPAENEVYDSENDEDDTARLRRMEADMDYMFDEFKKRRNIIDKKRKQKLGLDGEEDQLPGEEKPQDEKTAVQKVAAEFSSDDEDDGKNPLVVSMGDNEVTAEQKAARWFDRDLFAGLGEEKKGSAMEDDDEDDDSDDSEDDDPEDAAPRWAHEMEQGFADKKSKSKQQKKRREEEEEDDGEEEEEDEEENKRGNKRQRVGDKDVQVRQDLSTNDKKRANDQKAASKQEQKRIKDQEGKQMEVVPVDNEEEFTDDEDARAEVLAIGKAMLRAKDRTRIMNSSYNRFAFGDDENDLPEWFRMEETRHNRPELPATKAQVMEFKEQLKAINARPIKKIAEARARKRMKAVKKWEKIKQQANSIANQEGVSEGEKIKNIEKLYSGRNKGKGADKKRGKKYVVSKSRTNRVEARKTTQGGRTTFVDSVMKKEKKAAKRREKKNGKRKRK